MLCSFKVGVFLENKESGKMKSGIFKYKTPWYSHWIHSKNGPRSLCSRGKTTQFSNTFTLMTECNWLKFQSYNIICDVTTLRHGGKMTLERVWVDVTDNRETNSYGDIFWSLPCQIFCMLRCELLFDFITQRAQSPISCDAVDFNSEHA